MLVLIIISVFFIITSYFSFIIFNCIAFSALLVYPLGLILVVVSTYYFVVYVRRYRRALILLTWPVNCPIPFWLITWGGRSYTYLAHHSGWTFYFVTGLVVRDYILFKALLLEFCSIFLLGSTHSRGHYGVPSSRFCIFLPPLLLFILFGGRLITRWPVACRSLEDSLF